MSPLIIMMGSRKAKMDHSREHYCETYDDVKRFISYYYQAKLIKELGMNRILEVGIGNKLLSDYLRRFGLQMTTCDINGNLEPDYVADIRQMPFENDSFEVVVAFEILEHLVWNQVPNALKELHRVTEKYAVISIPYITAYLELVLRFPLINKIFKRPYLDFFIRLPFSFFRKCPAYHEWEAGLKNYSIKTVRKELTKYFRITREVRPVLNPLHYFFVLEKVAR